MNKLLFAAALLSALAFSVSAQDPKVVEASFRVEGNCNMCKNRIEKSLKIREVKYAKWESRKQEVKVAYLSPSITLDSLQQRVAAVGHDTEKFEAPDDVYSSLPGCCRYRDSKNIH